MEDNEGRKLVEKILAEDGERPILEISIKTNISDEYRVGMLWHLLNDGIVIREYLGEDIDEKHRIYFRDISALQCISSMELVHRFNLQLNKSMPSRSLIESLKSMIGRL